MIWKSYAVDIDDRGDWRGSLSNASSGYIGARRVGCISLTITISCRKAYLPRIYFRILAQLAELQVQVGKVDRLSEGAKQAQC